jgi:hypothetical protein
MIVNYLNAGGPGNVPPTVAQALGFNTLNVSLSPTSTLDSSQAITHNWGLPNSDISSGWPFIHVQPMDLTAGSSGWYNISQASNFVIVGRVGTTAGIDTANAQIIVSIARPHSMIR